MPVGRIPTRREFRGGHGVCFASPKMPGDIVPSATRLLLDHVVPLDRPRVEAALQDCLKESAAGTRLSTAFAETIGSSARSNPMWSIENAPDGKPLRAFATNLDITEMKRAEEHTKLADGRGQSSRQEPACRRAGDRAADGKYADPATFIARLTDRIDGLATSQDLLVKNNWQGVEVSHLVEGQLAHFKDLIGQRVLLHGTACSAETSGRTRHRHGAP